MRTRLLISLALVLSACGNYSNDDIAFLEAIPEKGALSLVVPAPPSGALVSGDAPLHALTVGSAQNINGMVGGITGLLDLIQKVSPSQRTADSRTWGPFDDTKNPGYEVEVTLTRDSDSYQYAFSERKKGAATFSPIITGEFFTQSAHLGHGTLDFDNEGLFQIGIDGGSPGLSAIDVTYANDATPRTVQTTLVGARSTTDGGNGVITFNYQQQPDLSGKLIFDAIADFAASGQLEDLHLISVWNSSGAGRSDGELSGGRLDTIVPGLTLTDQISECWNGQFSETYFNSELEDADAGAPGIECNLHPSCPDGDSSSCALPPGSP